MGFVIGSVVFAIASSALLAWFVVRRRGSGSAAPAVAMLVLGIVLVLVSTLVEQTEIGRWPAVTDSYARGEQWCVRYVPPPEEGDARVECRASEDAAWRWADRYTAELEATYGPSTRQPEGWALLIGLYGWALVAASVVWLVWRAVRRQRGRRSRPSARA